MNRRNTLIVLCFGFGVLLTFPHARLLAAPDKTGATASQPASQPASAPASRPAKKAKVKITLSRETTRILGPVNADGTVNYVAYINAKMSKGVTPDNNAAIALLKAVGPSIIPEKIREKTYKLLQIKPLPEKGDYFVRLTRYAASLPERLRKLVPENVDVEELAYQQWRKALEGPWSAKDYPIIADWLRANEKPLALITAATKKPRYYMPAVSSSDPPQMINVLLPSLSTYREYARALAIRAMNKMEQGDVPGAWADVMTTHRLARKVGQGWTLIERLVAIAIDAIAISAETTMATSGKLSAAQARACLADMQALHPLPGMIEAVNQCERFCSLDCVMIFARHGARKGFGWLGGLGIGGRRQPRLLPDRLDWDEMLKNFNRWYDRMVEAMSAKTPAERKKLWEAFDNDLVSLMGETSKNVRGWGLAKTIAKSVLGTPRMRRRHATRLVGNLLISILLPSLGRAQEFYLRGEMRMHLARLAMAMAAYKAEKGGFPAKLADLAPAYIKKIPQDIFSGKPLVYKRTDKGYLLYSVGINLKDDGGADTDRENRDIVVRVK